MGFCGVGRRFDQRSLLEERCPTASKTSAIRSVVTLNNGFWCYYVYCSPGTMLFLFYFPCAIFFSLDWYDFSISLHNSFVILKKKKNCTVNGVRLWLRKSHLSPLTKTRRFFCQDRKQLDGGTPTCSKQKRTWQCSILPVHNEKRTVRSVEEKQY